MTHDHNWKAMAWLGFVLLATLLITTVSAGQGIDINPVSLNITSTTSSVDLRTLTITANENVTDIKVLPLDLSSSDGKGIINQQSIHPALYSASMENGSIQHIPLTFDLTKAKGGQYTGEIWVSSSGTGVMKVPVTATVKDDWLLPFIILIVGVILSYSLFRYGDSFKKADEISRTLGVIFAGVQNDQELETKYHYYRDNSPDMMQYTEFRNKIHADMETVQQKLATKETSDADKFLKNLQTNWDTWKNCRSRLLSLFSQCSDLIAALNDIEGEMKKKTGSGAYDHVPLISTMRKNLQDTFDNILNDTDQKTMAAAIVTNRGIYDTFHKTMKRLQDLENTCKPKDPNTCKACQELDVIWKSLESTSDQNDLEKKFSEIDTKCKEADSCQQKAGTTFAGTLGKSFGINLPPALRPVEIPGRDIPSEGYLAGLRLLVYDFGIFLVMIVVLAGYGFLQFYIANPTFGASLGDYITLLLWGFMAGPAADTIAGKAKGKVGLE